MSNIQVILVDNSDTKSKDEVIEILEKAPINVIATVTYADAMQLLCEIGMTWFKLDDGELLTDVVMDHYNMGYEVIVTTLHEEHYYVTLECSSKDAVKMIHL
jgi:hypothetical protein